MSVANPLTTIPTKSSSDADWIGWYDILPFSKKDNNLLFTKAWQERGTSTANTTSLREHLKANGLDLAANNILGDLSDFKYNVLDTVGSVFKVGSVWVIGGMAIGSLFMMFMAYRLLTPENTGVIIGTAAKAAVG